jgi:hypothetical protein
MKTVKEKNRFWGWQEQWRRPYSVSKSFVSRREAAGSAVARQGEATTIRVI